MEDSRIIELYFERDEAAIRETAEKYEAYLFSVAENILHNESDSRECVNDAYVRAWNSIPPERPLFLKAFLGKIARNLAFDRYRREHSAKRGEGEIELVLDELSELLSSGESVEDSILRDELIREINAYLSGLPKDQCNLFVMRYWYVMSVGEISGRTGLTRGNVSTQLSRIRKGLKDYLTDRGYQI